MGAGGADGAAFVVGMEVGTSGLIRAAVVVEAGTDGAGAGALLEGAAL
jgi:hypothetical protein